MLIRLVSLLALLACFMPTLAFANRAEVMMLPTRVVMEDKDRFATVIVKNVGNATGDFTVELEDMKMLETGMVVPLDQGEKPQFSAMSMIHASPKSMTLKPGDAQRVMLLLRKPEGLEPGEYRTHLKVRLVNDNTDTPANTTGKDAVIAVKAHLVIVIPVIVRHGATSYAMGISDPKLGRDEHGVPKVDMYLTREGNRSSMGDIKVTYLPAGGSPQVIKIFRGVSVYRPTARRFISVPLDEMPKGVTLGHGKLDIVYATQEKEGGKKIAETELSLQ
jgi:hypothetical protein